MDIVPIDPAAPDQEIIARAAELIREGRLVAFPTETVYGLGANALDPIAVDRIYAAKGRPTYNPLIVHVADAQAARNITAAWPDAAETLARRFWPGPITFVLPKRENVPDSVTAGLASVAVRVPAHPVALALLRAAQRPIAAPSANRSMMLSPTTAAHVAKSLGDAVDLILDGGPTEVGIESTVVDLTAAEPRILRPGMITANQIRAAVGALGDGARIAGDVARPSPGMLDRHYSPRARLMLADPETIGALVDTERKRGKIVGAVVITAPTPPGTFVRLPESASGYAARLYEALHALDESACDVIIVEHVPDAVEWDGVRDRLERAAVDDLESGLERGE